jgi:hypothetical protein
MKRHSPTSRRPTRRRTRLRNDPVGSDGVTANWQTSDRRVLAFRQVDVTGITEPVLEAGVRDSAPSVAGVGRPRSYPRTPVA